ncbi:hypothetical protein M0E87_12215 [Corynebacterium sp. CCM 9185]|uniref:Uncharacterized protein n=1 Tax=Corynebacterium marambiense TaxID=2765364 RepID=A0ABS0VXU5_9CORY|nr:hypothetical protein [Corynebacterium marambiense]MBI9001583.1 hypothetical protein [Corynebacterium marambiense]MCK7664407.1 hypothetical protein [Corynebacterium marambiense]
MARTITAILATRQLQTNTLLRQTSVRKIAGYARVPIDHDDQVTSYEVKID